MTYNVFGGMSNLAQSLQTQGSHSFGYKKIQDFPGGMGIPSSRQNGCVFSNLLNSKMASSESHEWRDRLFQRRGPTTINEQSPRLVRVNGTSQRATLDNKNRRWLVAVVSWQ